MGEVIPLFRTARALVSGPWNPFEQSALDAFAARFADRAPWGVETVMGMAEAGEPWMALCCKRTGETLVHVARAGGRYIALGSDGLPQAEGGDLNALLRRVSATPSLRSAWDAWPLSLAGLGVMPAEIGTAEAAEPGPPEETQGAPEAIPMQVAGFGADPTDAQPDPVTVIGSPIAAERPSVSAREPVPRLAMTPALVLGEAAPESVPAPPLLPTLPPHRGAETPGGEHAPGPLAEGGARLVGTDRADRNVGGDGADTILGGAGDDGIRGGAGNDRLAGGDGDDTVAGEGGQDSLEGGAGQDLLEGGEGEDAMTGGEGDDRLVGGTGADTLDGEAGDDSLDGAEGADWVAGGDGSDTITLGAGDVAIGGAGSDSFLAMLPPPSDTDPPLAAILDFSLTEDQLILHTDAGPQNRIALEERMADTAGRIRLDLNEDGRCDLVVILRLDPSAETAPGEIALSLDFRPLPHVAAQIPPGGPTAEMMEVVLEALAEAVVEDVTSWQSAPGTEPEPEPDPDPPARPGPPQIAIAPPDPWDLLG